MQKIELIKFINWMINDSTIENVFENPELTVNEYMNTKEEKIYVEALKKKEPNYDCAYVKIGNEEVEVKGWYTPTSRGDYHTPPKKSDFKIHQIIYKDINIYNLLNEIGIYDIEHLEELALLEFEKIRASAEDDYKSEIGEAKYNGEI